MTRSVDATTLMDWAELTFTGFFPSHQQNLVAGPYIFRYYPQTQIYLGVAGDIVRVFGPPFGPDIVTVGRLSDFACRVFPENCQPPVANAGAAQRVAVGALVSLDGSASSDPNSDPLTYQWTIASKPFGSGASLRNATTARPTFVPDAAGSYQFNLAVSDGTSTTTASTTVTAYSSTSAPIATATGSQSSIVGLRVNLTGSGTSFIAGTTLSYAWTFASRPTGSGAALSDAGTATPSFVPDVAGTYVVSLVVSDGVLSSSPSSATVSVGSSSSTSTSTSACCRVCTTGKPCGSSCISVTLTCHQSGGCAC